MCGHCKKAVADTLGAKKTHRSRNGKKCFETDFKRVGRPCLTQKERLQKQMWDEKKRSAMLKIARKRKKSLLGAWRDYLEAARPAQMATARALSAARAEMRARSNYRAP